MFGFAIASDKENKTTHIAMKLVIFMVKGTFLQPLILHDHGKSFGEYIL
jgi:hypothetical protein